MKELTAPRKKVALILRTVEPVLRKSATFILNVSVHTLTGLSTSTFSELTSKRIPQRRYGDNICGQAKNSSMISKGLFLGQEYPNLAVYLSKVSPYKRGSTGGLPCVGQKVGILLETDRLVKVDE